MPVNAEIMAGEFAMPASQSEELNINDEVFLRQNEYDLIGADIMGAENMGGFEELASNISSRSSLANLPVGQTTYSTTNTTPEMSSPPKLHPVSGHSFSLPIDQLNLLSLKSMSSTQSSKSPSPEYNLYSVIRENAEEEKTINPRQLFTEDIDIGVASASAVSASTDKHTNDVEDMGAKGYILPSSSSPSLSTLFDGTQRASYTKAKSHSISMGSNITSSKKFDFIMNNECFNAILYWINDTLQNVNSKMHDDDEELGGAEEIMVNPTGIIKSNYYKRRNSIQLVTPSIYNQHSSFEDDAKVQKKKRRKSYNYDYAKSMTKQDIQATPTTSNSESVVPTHNRHNSDIVKESLNEARNISNDEDEQDKPFPCPDCSKQFKRSEHLKRHIRSVHSNIRPFHCKYCEKKFSRSDNLAQHLKTHYKVNTNGTTTIIYGNPNLHNRGGRKKHSD